MDIWTEKPLVDKPILREYKYLDITHPKPTDFDFVGSFKNDLALAQKNRSPYK